MSSRFREVESGLTSPFALPSRHRVYPVPLHHHARSALMTILLTGAAGFIGFHVAAALLARGEQVIGVDNVNDYYDPALKEARLAQLQGKPGFTFERLSIADRAAVDQLIGRHPGIDRVVHLAAQAGVRYSLVNPQDSVVSNVTGQLVMLEACRRLKQLDR